MAEGNQSKVFKDVKEFGRFFTSLWGLLSGGAVLFPFINRMITTIPAPNDNVIDLSAGLSMLGSSFAFLLIYLTRQLYLKLDDPSLNIYLNCKKKFRIIKIPFAGYRSMILSCVYFAIFAIVLVNYLSAYWDGEYSLGNLIYKHDQISGVIQYIAIFMLATITFSTLAAAEYMRQLSKIEKERMQDWPHYQLAINAINERRPMSDRTPMVGLKINSEKRIVRDGQKLLEMEVELNGNIYNITIDSSGTVMEYKA